MEKLKMSRDPQKYNKSGNYTIKWLDWAVEEIEKETARDCCEGCLHQNCLVSIADKYDFSYCCTDCDGYVTRDRIVGWLRGRRERNIGEKKECQKRKRYLVQKR